MSAADRLAEIQARSDKAATLVGALAAGTADWRMRVPVHSDDSNVVLMGTAEDCEKAVAALRAALDLHKAISEEGFDVDVCERCSSTAGAGVAVSWPCLTVRVIENSFEEGR